MKKSIKLIYAALAVVFVLATFGVSRVVAASQKSVSLGAGETAQGLFVRAGDSITINGTVNGDVVVAGSNIDINGKVTGSVYAVGQTVTVRGEVAGNVHAAGSTVTVGGKVGGSVYAAGASILLDNGVEIKGAAAIAGSALTVNGTVGNQLYAAGSNLTLNGKVGSDVTTAVTQLTVSKDASVEGGLKYYSRTQASIADDTKIHGSINWVQPAKAQGSGLQRSIVTIIYGIVAMLALGAVLIFVAPKTVVSVSDQITAKPLQSLLAGFGFTILTPIVVVFALLTVIGIPLAVLVLLGYIAALVTGTVFSALWIGRMIVSEKSTQTTKNITALTVGLLVIAVAKLVPLVGGFVVAISFLVGVGALVLRMSNRVDALHTRQRVQKAK